MENWTVVSKNQTIAFITKFDYKYVYATDFEVHFNRDTTLCSSYYFNKWLQLQKVYIYQDE